MECNKDEAVRAKSIAESKLEQKDYVGAKKFALKAQALYPGLDGIPQILTVLDVYVSAENKIGGLVDWYAVLGVNPFADDDLIKKQYRKLALMLHPDKNKAIGADGAFKLISEAWSLLSDKVKRMAYNQQRGFRVFQQKPPVHTGGPSTQARTHTGVPSTQAPPHTSGPSTQAPMHTSVPSATSEENQFKFACWKTSAPKSKKKSAKEPPAARPSPSQVPGPSPSPSLPQQRPDAFWTVCKHCKIHYEYLLMYLNKFLLCPTCNEPFLASRADLPVNYSKSSRVVPWNPQLRKINCSDNLPTQNGSGLERNAAGTQTSGSRQTGLSSSGLANNQQAPVSGTTANTGNMDPSITAKAANVVHRAQGMTKRPHAAKAANVSQQAVDTTKKPDMEKTANVAHQAQGTIKRPLTENAASVVHQAQGIKRPLPGSHATAEREGSTKKRKPHDDNSKYGMKLKMEQANSGFKTSRASGSRIYGFSGTYPHQSNTRELTPYESRRFLMEKARKELMKNLSKLRSQKTAAAADKEEHSRINEHSAKGSMMSVPDPDFFDFDQDRTESSFSDNEVWSAYDDADSMPRFYALINKVITRNPLKLKLSWLNSKTNSEFSSIDWVGSGFIKTCGEFRIGKYEKCKSLYAFSQKVNWLKGPNGCILILPQKGDVWALYKNWSSDWNKSTPADVVHQYDMVMVIDDYSEEHGVSVSPLEKVVGFKTVFRPNMAPEVIRRIPKEEMFRFSHQVPNHLLTGQEAQNAPKGCLELDPAAMSHELLQMTAETKGPPVVTDSNNMQSIPVASVDEIADMTSKPPAVKC